MSAGCGVALIANDPGCAWDAVIVVAGNRPPGAGQTGPSINQLSVAATAAGGLGGFASSLLETAESAGGPVQGDGSSLAVHSSSMGAGVEKECAASCPLDLLAL
jgi:hypothetical protein